MEKRKFTREFWIGFLGILSLVIIYLLINFFKGISLFNEGSIYYVRFNDIGEIVKTSSVYVNGYKVGNVQEIEYDFEKGNGACVTLSLDKRLHIPVGSTAEINKELLSSSSISIIQGHSNSYLMPGDTLNGRLKSDAMEVAGEMLPAIGDMLPKIDSILISLNNTLANPSINNTLNNVEPLTAQLNSTSKDLDNLLNGDIATASSKLVALEDQMLELSTKLNEIEYQRIVASLETSLKNLEEITASLNNGEGTAGMLLKDSSLYIRLNETCESANALLEDLKEHPKRYVHFSIFGNKQK
jgi:phospholipid/cholesterol/gamma-HCH transport system substrate-binding protein